LITHELLQYIEIHGHTVLALGDEFREESLELGKVMADEVR
jgi:hypothetical protein